MIGSKKFLWTVVVLLGAIGVVQTVRVRQVQTEYNVGMAQAVMVCKALAERIQDQQTYIQRMENFIQTELKPEIEIYEPELREEGDTVPEDGGQVQPDEEGSGGGLGGSYGTTDTRGLPGE